MQKRLKRRLRIVIIGASALAVGGVVMTAINPASATTFKFAPPRAVNITNNNWASCLDVNKNHRTENGAEVQLYACHTNVEGNQEWIVERDSALDGFRIKLVDLPGKCLDAHGGDLPQDNGYMPTTNGYVQMWDCNGSLQQLWDLHQLTISDGFPEMADPALNMHFGISNRAGTDSVTRAGLGGRWVLGVVDTTAEDDGDGRFPAFRRADVSAQRASDERFSASQTWDSPALTCAYLGYTRVAQGAFGQATCS